jgi:hypothetical protein
MRQSLLRKGALDVLGARVRVSFFERPPMTFAASEVG